MHSDNYVLLGWFFIAVSLVIVAVANGGANFNINQSRVHIAAR